MRFGVDPWPRIEFYVRHGLVKRRPTAEQLEKASKLNVYYGGGFTERIMHYARHPLDLFPTKTKKQELLRMKVRTGGKETGPEELQATATVHGSNTPEPLLDHLLSAQRGSLSSAISFRRAW